MPPEQPPAEPRRTRRAVLRTGLSTALAGGLGATAGCIETLPPLGQRVRFGSIEPPASRGDPTYRTWIPDASAFPDAVDVDESSVVHATPRTGGSDVVGAPLSFGRDLLASQLDFFGVGVEHYDALVGVGPVTVLEGEFGRDLVAATLTRSGYQSAGTYEGHQRFERADVPRVALVSDGTIVWASHGDGVDVARDCTEAVVDAGAGRAARMHEVDDAFATITERTGDWPFVDVGQVFVDPIDEALTGSWSLAYDDRFVYWLHRTLYPHGTSVAERAVRRALEENEVTIEAQVVEVHVDGRVATVLTQHTHEQYVSEYEPRRQPQVTWGVARDGSSDAVTLRHEAGETVPADELAVELHASTDRPADAQFADAHDLVTPGDELAVHAGRADELRLLWDPPDRPAMAILLDVGLP